MDKQNLFLETLQDHFANYEKLLEQVSNFTFLKIFFPLLDMLYIREGIGLTTILHGILL
jgi:hypothetical protein